MEPTALEAMFAQTILAPAVKALLTGQFISAPSEPVKENEKIIGELTLFEKAIFTARDVIVDEHNAWVKIVQEGIENGEQPDADVYAKNRIDDEIHKSIDSLFWTSIHRRLGAKSYEGGDIAIRSDYQIVSTPRFETEFVDFLQKMKEEVENITGLHICEGCPNYEECDLSIKKPR